MAQGDETRSRSEAEVIPYPKSWRLPDGAMPFGIPEIVVYTPYLSLSQIGIACSLKRHNVEALFDLKAIPAQCYRQGARSRNKGFSRIRAVKTLPYVKELLSGNYAWLNADAIDCD
jgi:hypothetical protein